MRELTPQEQRTFRRLRSAFRRAGLSVMKRKGSMEEVTQVCRRVTAHAMKLGWLAVSPSAKIEEHERDRVSAEGNLQKPSPGTEASGSAS